MAQKIEKLRNMSPDDMDKEERELREEIWKLRLQMTTGQLQDPHKVRRARRDLARLMTVRRQAELATQKGDRR